MKKILCAIEIVLMVVSSISLSFMISQTNMLPNDSLPITQPSPYLKKVLLLIFGNNFVSAQGLYTCPLNNQGAACQEYSSESCTANCQASCFPGRRADFLDCQLGTCLDRNEGTCSSNTPRTLCLEQGGEFDERSSSEVPFCRKGCCVTSSGGRFMSEQQCTVVRQREGILAQFEPVTSELQCIGLGQAQQDGACIVGEVEPGVNSCRRVTGAVCQQMRGAFYPGLLCSNTELHTNCQAQARASCVEGKDEVYWFDSCNNIENIVDYARRNELKSQGRIVSKDQSCSLGTGNNPFANQARCGNCNYLGGSVCGAFTSSTSGSPLQFGGNQPASVVCRDLSCTDENGVKRKHGESWCAFNSAIGIKGLGNAQRSVDVTGSRHYREVCLNGEIRTEPCQDFRNEVCVEDRNEEARFSQAICRINQWQLCVNANQQPTIEAMKTECLRHTDCYIKNVDLRQGGNDNFAFSMCAPKYPPGFDVQAPSGVEVAESVCGLASQSCTYVKVKGLFSSKKANGNCLSPEFTETMNNLCMSLGDCGAKVNIVGEYTDDSYRVTQAPAVRQGYVTTLKTYTDPIRGQKVEPLNSDELASLLGLAGGFDGVTTPTGSEDLLTSISGVSGALGGAASLLTYTNVFGFGSVVLNPASAGVVYTHYTLEAFAGAASGALLGAAATAFLLKATGVGAGLPAPIVIALTISGAASGALIAENIITAGSFQAGLSTCLAGGTGCIIAGIILLITAFLSLFGIGKKKTVKVEFQCLPWQPPIGGSDCSSCGENGLPCSRYACQSLGQTCQFIENAESGAACVDANPNDGASPLISPNTLLLRNSYQYSDVSNLGFRLQGPTSGGCVPYYERISIGIQTNELAQCRIENAHTNTFDQMTHNFHNVNGIESNQFRTNHTFSFALPSSESLANDAAIDQETLDTEVFDEELVRPHDGRVDLYVRCRDSNGNVNTQEYAINFCVSPEPDRSAPLINQFNPPSPGYIALGASTGNVSWYVNEPAECRWDSRDIDYGLMVNSATCITDGALGSYLGWACTANVPAPVSGDATYHIRCSDQPWLLGNETDGRQRNMNMQSIPYEIRATTAPLRIVSTLPSNRTISTNGLPALVNLEVITEGGAPGLGRMCSFTWGTSTVSFLETGTDRHRQPNLNLFEARAYSIPIMCHDTIGNSASATIAFNVEVDAQGPSITRAYSQNGLTVVTNEVSDCVFSLSSCSFGFANGTRMRGSGRVHTSPFSADVTHYVVCKDTFSNIGRCLALRQGVL